VHNLPWSFGSQPVPRGLNLSNLPTHYPVVVLSSVSIGMYCDYSFILAMAILSMPVLLSAKSAEHNEVLTNCLNLHPVLNCSSQVACDLHEKREVGLHAYTWICSTAGNLQLQIRLQTRAVSWLSQGGVRSATYICDIHNVTKWQIKWLQNISGYRHEA